MRFAIVPYYCVPETVPFRSKKEWWVRSKGNPRYAMSKKHGVTVEFNPQKLVAVAINQLPPRLVINIVEQVG